MNYKYKLIEYQPNDSRLHILYTSPDISSNISRQGVTAGFTITANMTANDIHNEIQENAHLFLCKLKKIKNPYISEFIGKSFENKLTSSQETFLSLFNCENVPNYAYHESMCPYIKKQLLSECDWTQLDDAPLTNEQKLAWRTYRQKLRDISIQDNEVIWPERPS
jgi:hypothetical protein